MKLNHKGFGALEAILIIVVIALVGAAGWVAWSRLHKSEPAPDSTATTSDSKTTEATKTATYTPPEGYSTLDAADYGFSLSYPKAYGEFVKQAPENNVRILATDSLQSTFAPGTNGPFTIYSREPFNAVINSRKYGPQIQLQNDKWIVTETNPADTENVVGKEYLDLDGNKATSQKNGSLTVYTLNRWRRRRRKHRSCHKS